MPKGKSDQNTGILEYALRHLEQEREDIQSKIDHIRRQLGGSVSSGDSRSGTGGSSACRSPWPQKTRTQRRGAETYCSGAEKALGGTSQGQGQGSR